MNLVSYYSKNRLITNASREGARYGIVQVPTKPAVSDINKVVQAYLKNAGLETTRVPDVSCKNDAGVTKACNLRTFGDLLTVRMDYPYTFLFLSRFTGGSPSLTLSATTTMKNE